MDEKMEKMKGYFLPQISVQEVRREINGVGLDFPVLAPAQVAQLSEGLIASHEKLAEISILKIVDWLDLAARRWLDRNDPIRAEAESILPALTGASKEMTRFSLDDLFKNLRRPVLIQLLEEELGDPMLLDHFRPKRKGSGFTRAFGPRLISHLLPGNVAGTSVMSLACGLLAKSSNLAKMSADELLLPVLFAETLRQIEPEWARTLAVTTWENDAVEITEAAFQKSDLVVVYGSEETIEKVRGKVPPAARAIYHGHKLSLGIVAREMLHPALAEQAAIDIALYDQRGCLSPHLYYVEQGGAASPIEFAQWLAQSLYVVSYQLPKGPTSPDEAAKIQQLRGALPLKGGRVFPSPKGLDWTVLYDPDPGFSVSPLARTIWIKPVEELTRVPLYLEPIRPYLQGVGIAVPTDRQPQIVPTLARMGATRICPIGRMQMPPMTWHHDGRFRLLNLLRFVDWENP